MKEITTTEETTTSVETTTHDCDGVESTVDLTTETASLLSTIMTSLSSLIPITNSQSGNGANCHLTQTAIQTMVTNMSMKNASAFEVVEQMDKEWKNIYDFLYAICQTRTFDIRIEFYVDF